MWDPAKTLAGATAGSFTPWAIFRADGIQAEIIVRETQSDLDVTAASPTLLTLHQQGVVTAGEHNLSRFRLSEATDSRADNAFGLARSGDVSAHGVAITPRSTSGSQGATFTALGDSSVLVSGSHCCSPVYSVAAALSASHITGFRLDVMKRRLAALGRAGARGLGGQFPLVRVRRLLGS